jgi:hypothetical protein
VFGVYTLDILGDLSSFTIDATGAISGQSIAGCVFNGQVTIIDATFNAYDVALDVMDINNCGVLDGMYDGLGFTLDNDTIDDEFWFAVFTNQSTAVGVAVK